MDQEKKSVRIAESGKPAYWDGRYEKDRERILAWAKKKRLEDPIWAERQREALNERQRRRGKDPEYRAQRNRRRALARYGLTEVDYERLLEEQGGKCAICLTRPEDFTWGSILHIDHCHDTGKVRGLLCPPCNTGMGKLKDNPDMLRRAADYLEKAR